MVWFSGLKRPFKPENQTVSCIMGRRLEFFTSSCPDLPHLGEFSGEEAARRFLSAVYAFDQLAPKPRSRGFPDSSRVLGRSFTAGTPCSPLCPRPLERAFLLRC
jgi:hypothetical protein